MRIKPNSLLAEAIQERCGDGTARVVYIGVAYVVHQDENNVRWRMFAKDWCRRSLARSSLVKSGRQQRKESRFQHYFLDRNGNWAKIEENMCKKDHKKKTEKLRSNGFSS